MTTPERQYELHIRAIIRDMSLGGGNVDFEESITINASSFIEMASILGKVHELAQKIDSEAKGK